MWTTSIWDTRVEALKSKRSSLALSKSGMRLFFLQAAMPFNCPTTRFPVFNSDNNGHLCVCCTFEYTSDTKFSASATGISKCRRNHLSSIPVVPSNCLFQNHAIPVWMCTIDSCACSNSDGSFRYRTGMVTQQSPSSMVFFFLSFSLSTIRVRYSHQYNVHMDNDPTKGRGRTNIHTGVCYGPLVLVPYINKHATACRLYST